MAPMDESAVFRTRFARHENELKQLYFKLYHNDEQAWNYFVDMLRRMWDARSDELRALDAARESNPSWYKGHELVGMLMYVSAFAKTLAGVREKLDYIQDCGVNYLHLMPLLESPAGRSDGGYAVSDFRKVQPELGTMEDLAALADECHRRGVSVCLDFVMNHTSEDHEWARRARAGERAMQDRYFFYDNWGVPLQYERTVPQVFPTTAPGNFSWCEEAGKVVMTTFYPYQWDLNYANPAVFNDMTENMLYLCNQGVDIIRLDAVPYIWKELGTNCRNLPQVHELVRLMRMVCEIVCPGALLLGEVVMEPSKVVPYFGTVEKPECHLLYNVTTMASTWHTVATKDVRLLRHQLGQVFALPKEYGFLNYLRCHDDIGWGLDYAFLKQFGMEEVAHKKYLNDYLTGKWPGSPARGELYNDALRRGIGALRKKRKQARLGAAPGPGAARLYVHAQRHPGALQRRRDRPGKRLRLPRRSAQGGRQPLSAPRRHELAGRRAAPRPDDAGGTGLHRHPDNGRTSCEAPRVRRRGGRLDPGHPGQQRARRRPLLPRRKAAGALQLRRAGAARFRQRARRLPRPVQRRGGRQIRPDGPCRRLPLAALRF